MMKRSAIALLAVVLAGAAATGFADDPERAAIEQARALFKPLPKEAFTGTRPSADMIELGRALFFETRVSTDGRQACATCHNPAYYGADSLAVSLGVHGARLPRNAPTVFNTPLLVAQHYGGNRETVEEQALKALTSPVAYGNKNYDEAAERMRAAGYGAWFARVFRDDPKPVSAQNWATAIGAFERTLLTPAPFDRFLEGDDAAIGAQAKRGLAKFVSTGCVACHNGVTVGGQMFQKFGLTQDYWLVTLSKEQPLLKGRDMGKFHDTNKEEDKWIFKVPQLRNVAVTPPYFHDGSVASLSQAVKVMGKLQLGRDISDADASDIVAFLETLTGEIPKQFAAPALPVAPYLN